MAKAVAKKAVAKPVKKVRAPIALLYALRARLA
jgi:hypothetical protein